MNYDNKLIAKNIYKLRDEFHTLTMRPADLWTWKHVEYYLDLLGDYFKNLPDTPATTGVTRIIAGTNISISPIGGTGDVTINTTTPDLQSVTDAGNTTTNDIEVNSIHVNGDFSNYNKNIPDIGAIQTSDARGYGNDYIAEKTLAYCRIGASAFDEEGAVRIKNNVFQTYIDGAWQDVVTNFRFREDENGDYELEHKPIGFQWWIEVNSGNSDNVGLNGLPIVQNYKVSMGAYPVPLEIDGGTF